MSIQVRKCVHTRDMINQVRWLLCFKAGHTTLDRLEQVGENMKVDLDSRLCSAV